MDGAVAVLDSSVLSATEGSIIDCLQAEDCSSDDDLSRAMRAASGGRGQQGKIQAQLSQNRFGTEECDFVEAHRELQSVESDLQKPRKRNWRKQKARNQNRLKSTGASLVEALRKKLVHCQACIRESASVPRHCLRPAARCSGQTTRATSPGKAWSCETWASATFQVQRHRNIEDHRDGSRSPAANPRTSSKGCCCWCPSGVPS